MHYVCAAFSSAKPSPFDKLRVRECGGQLCFCLSFSLTVPKRPPPELVEGGGTTEPCRFYSAALAAFFASSS
jgi:hypothetical protein